MPTNSRPNRLALVAFLAAMATACGWWSPGKATNKNVEPIYDPKTGKLVLLKSDSKGTGKIDTWAYMDGSRFIRKEIDTDGDGKVDRWEYFDDQNKMTKLGLARSRGGPLDAWGYLAADGSIERLEMFLPPDGKTNRIERYKAGKLVSVDEDGDEDGTMDKWQTWQDGRLVAEAFDTSHSGKPDRRLVYDGNGVTHLQVDRTGSGTFVDARVETAPQSGVSTVTPARRN